MRHREGLPYVLQLILYRPPDNRLLEGTHVDKVVTVQAHRLSLQALDSRRPRTPFLLKLKVVCAVSSFHLGSSLIALLILFSWLPSKGKPSRARIYSSFFL